MNEENEREKRVEEVEIVEQEVGKKFEHEVGKSLENKKITRK